MKRSKKSICPICGDNKEQGTTTFTIDIVIGIIVVRNVPATICSQCGEEWIENKTAKLSEKITTDARKKQYLQIFAQKVI